MKLSFSSLPEIEQIQLRRITDFIIKSVQPEYLFCYGSRTDTMLARNCFDEEEQETQYKCQYDLVLIAGDDDKRTDERLHQLAQRAAGPYASLNILVYRRAQVEHHLQQYDYFFSKIFAGAIRLHEPETAISATPVSKPELPQEEQRKHCRVMAISRLCDAEKLIRQAERDIQEGRRQRALESLNKSVYESLTAVLLYHTGCVPNPVNVKILLGLSANVCSAPARLFPANTPEEKSLRDLLENALGTGQELGNINPDQLHQLRYRVRELHQAIEGMTCSVYYEMPFDSPQARA
ncbi:MAG: hypothetical protein JST39_21495 [Bacteroidetes bacterium]|nr:hypothetical protein [Bacteroidota bacterium]